MDDLITTDQESVYKFKVVLVGDTFVGVSELSNSLCHSKGYYPIGVAIVTKSFQICRKRIQLQIWDISGYQRYLPESYNMFARGASGAMVLYDVTRRSSFENLDRFFSILDPETTTMMLGNKCDMTDKREVTKEEGEKLASEKGIKFIETSAKNDVNVEEAFTILVKDMLLRRELKSFQEFITSPEVSSNTLDVNTAKT